MSNILTSYTELFERDLNKAIKEVNLYKSEEDLWKTEGDISNSGGNLVLHIIGNLRHFFGSVLGGTDYVRNRELEFNSKNVHREELILGLQLAIKDVKKTLDKMDEAKLDDRFPIDVLRHEMTTGFFIAHLLGHLNYHLGQVNYHRRQLK